MTHDDWQSARTPKLKGELELLGGAERRLWSTSVLILLIFTAGFLIMAVPALFWSPAELPPEALHRLQSVAGLLTIILIFSGYIYDQRRKYHRTREALVREIIFSERLASFTTIDPLTQVFNRNYLDQVAPREINRANRQGTDLTFLLLHLDNYKRVLKKHGEPIADQLLVDTAQLLKSTFRGSDVILRYDVSSFLVILPDTDEYQAGCALRRLLSNTDQWNVDTRLQYEISFNGGTAGYYAGADLGLVLHELGRSIESHQYAAAGD